MIAVFHHARMSVAAASNSLRVASSASAKFLVCPDAYALLYLRPYVVVYEIFGILPVSLLLRDKAATSQY